MGIYFIGHVGMAALSLYPDKAISIVEKWACELRN
jgi:hypothetical protein